MKRDLVATMMALIILSTALTVKAFNPAATPATARQAITISNRMGNPIALPATMDIVPASVIDSSAAHFIGTGDGSVGSWSRP